MATCRGIDLSTYQGTQDWAKHKADGVVFAFVKASEGQSSRDARFATHITGAKKAGLVVGGYHFGWPTQDPAREAANYIAAVRPHAGSGFCHWLDLERYTDGRNYTGRTGAQIKAWVAKWRGLVAEAFPGQRVGVYTSGDDLAKGHVPTGVPLWYPAYPKSMPYERAEVAARPKPSGWTPLFWQFTSTPIDRSICYLSAAELRAWAAGTTTPTPTPSEDPMAGFSKDDIYQTVWGWDRMLPPAGTATDANPKWKPESILRDIAERVRALQVTEAAQTAAITGLASAIGTLDAAVDVPALVASVRTAITTAVEGVTVRLDAPDN